MQITHERKGSGDGIHGRGVDETKLKFDDMACQNHSGSKFPWHGHERCRKGLVSSCAATGEELIFLSLSKTRRRSVRMFVGILGNGLVAHLYQRAESLVLTSDIGLSGSIVFSITSWSRRLTI